MIDRVLAPGRYGFDTLGPGDGFITGAAAVTADIIDRFAALTGDRFEIHMDTDAAARHGFDGRVAHGLLVLSLVDGLKNQSAVQFDAVASLGWDWTFRAPVLAEDRIRAQIAVAAKRATSTPGRGILNLTFRVENQHGVIVQDGENKLMVYD